MSSDSRLSGLGLIVALLAAAGLLAWQFRGGHSSAELDGPVVELQKQEQFAAVTGSGVVLVDFYADWCGPCKALKPTLHQVARDYEGRATVLAVDVDRFGALAEQHQVRYIPHVVVYRDGELREKLSDLSPEGIAARLEHYGASAAPAGSPPATSPDAAPVAPPTTNP